MKDEKEKTEIGLRFTEFDDTNNRIHASIKFTVQPVYEDHKGEYMGMSYSGMPDDVRWLKNFTVENYLSIDFLEQGVHNLKFGYQYTEYEIIRATEAASMVKSLRMIERKIEKYYNKFGPTRSFGQDVQRIAQAIGAQYMVFKGDRGWYRLNIGDGVAKIDRTIDAYINHYSREKAISISA